MEFSHSLVCAFGSVYKFNVAFFKSFYFFLRVRIRFCYADTRHTAFNGSVDGSCALSSFVKRFFHRFAVMRRNDNHYRHTRENNERKNWVYAEKIREGKNYHNRADNKVFGAVMRKLTYLEKVARYSCHNTSRFVVIIEAEGELLQMIEQVNSHLRLHFYADNMAVILNEIAQKHSYYIERKHDYTGYNDCAVHSARNIIFKHFSRYNGVDHTYDRYKKRCEQIQHKHFFMRFIIAYKSFEHRGIILSFYKI